MNNSRNPRRIAGISLAIAVAGASAIVPAHAQTSPAAPSLSVTPDKPAGATPAAGTSKADPNQVLKGVGAVQSGVNELDKTVGSMVGLKPGSGSAQARYSSGGWTYTAVAYNSVADRLYAISTGEDGKPAGHLLRMIPRRDEVADLGALDLKGIKTGDVASAAFTPHGTLVLFSGSQYRAIDLSSDVVKEKVEQVSTLPVKSQKLTVEGKPGDVGLPSAWASLGSKESENQLFAVSRSPEGSFYKWTLDTTNGRVSISELTVASALRVDELGDLNYAFAKDRDTLVFADDQARTLEVRGDEVVGTYFGREITDNLRELAYLPKGAPYKPVTQANKPAPLAGDTAAAPSSRRTLPTFTAPTVIADSSEPTSIESSLLNDVETEPATASTENTGAGSETHAVPSVTTTTAAVDRTVKFTVADEAGHAKAGVPVELDELGTYTKTDKNGQVSVEIPASAGEVTAYVNGQPSKVGVNEMSHRVTLLADADTEADSSPSSEASASSAPSEASASSETSSSSSSSSVPAVPAKKKDVQITVQWAGKPLANADISSSNKDVEILDPKTDANGNALIRIPADQPNATFDVEAKFGNKSQSIRFTSGYDSRTIVLDQASSQDKTGDKTVNNKRIRVQVVTENGDPVQFASVYAKGATSIRLQSVDNPRDTTSEGALLTNENGFIDVIVLDSLQENEKVTLAVKTAPSGYKTVSKEVSPGSDFVELKLPKASTTTTSTKSRPQEILDIIDEVQPLVAAIGGPAAAGAALNRGTKTTSTKSTTTTSGTATSGARSTNLSGTVMTGRSTAASTTAAAARANSASSGGSRSTKAASKSTSTKTTSRDGDLAETGTPMTTVITLGILAVLIGGAYIALGRRRDA